MDGLKIVGDLLVSWYLVASVPQSYRTRVYALLYLIILSYALLYFVTLYPALLYSTLS